jgi:hypothetical protein
MARKLLLFVCLFLLLSACGKAEVKQPSLDSQFAREAFAVAEGMRKAYVQKDFEDFRKYCTEEAYNSIIRDIKRFDSAELEFTPRWVEIEGDAVVLNEQWKGSWVVNGQDREARGMAVFQLRGTPLKLSAVLRGSPFDQPVAGGERGPEVP